MLLIVVVVTLTLTFSDPPSKSASVCRTDLMAPEHITGFICSPFFMS